MSETKGSRCDYCDHETECCESEYTGFCCTRPKGHYDKHAACGCSRDTHPIFTWSDRELQNEQDKIVSSQERNGGAAFPVQNVNKLTGEYGMSLRDWFAGQALAGMEFSNYGELGDMAMDAYAVADHMLKVKN